QRGARRGAGARDPRDQPDRRAGEIRPDHPGSGVRERAHRHHRQGHPGARRQVGPVAAPAFTLREIVARLGGEAVGEVPAPLTGVATLDSAGPSQIAFLANRKYRGRLATTLAGAVILGRGDRDAATMPRIVSDNPYAYYARAVSLFHPGREPVPGVHPTAVVDATARVAGSAEIAAHVVVGAGAAIGEGAVIGPAS